MTTTTRIGGPQAGGVARVDEPQLFATNDLAIALIEAAVKSEGIPSLVGSGAVSLEELDHIFRMMLDKLGDTRAQLTTAQGDLASTKAKLAAAETKAKAAQPALMPLPGPNDGAALNLLQKLVAPALGNLLNTSAFSTDYERKSTADTQRALEDAKNLLPANSVVAEAIDNGIAQAAKAPYWPLRRNLLGATAQVAMELLGSTAKTENERGQKLVQKLVMSDRLNLANTDVFSTAYEQKASNTGSYVLESLRRALPSNPDAQASIDRGLATRGTTYPSIRHAILRTGTIADVRLADSLPSADSKVRHVLGQLLAPELRNLSSTTGFGQDYEKKACGDASYFISEVLTMMPADHPAAMTLQRGLDDANVGQTWVAMRNAYARAIDSALVQLGMK